MKKLNGMEMVAMSKCFLFVFLCGLAFAYAVHAKDTSDFISIDCGIPNNSNYTDSSTGLFYTSDMGFADSGVSQTVSPQYQNVTNERQFSTLRSFPDGDRNCYTLWPSHGRGRMYLIRAQFMYGNYDGKNQLPEFDMYVGVNLWETVTLDDPTTLLRLETILVPLTDYISICLVSKNKGTPFISALELRPLDNSSYVTKSGSLNLLNRWDLGATTNELIRYGDDVYDRIWIPFTEPGYTTMVTDNTVGVSNDFEPPSIVMSTAMTTNNNDSLSIKWKPKNASEQYYMYMHFAELQLLQPNQSRQFDISGSGEPYEGMVPDYLDITTIYSTVPESSPTFTISLNKTSNSTLPPIINALEIYIVRQLSDAETNDNDVDAILSIKSTYGLSRNWQGDPCGPKEYVWGGIACSYDGSDPPRIISLNLSSSGLTGVITPFIANLTVLHTLDLSNNNFTGPVPDLLARMDSLKVLNLKGNNFSSVPKELLAKSNSGSMLLSIDGFGGEIMNTTPPSKKKPNKILLAVLASVAGVAVLII